ncbi:BtaA family protein [Hymenobacter sp. BT175]|uniref:DUF3419 family protein n=1 Tax=Hymenobacter translucens TaxID=2886507 RepID=UPI001D0EADF4|nr:DUF3419 family protein [Hymenobacter translucens]MCC2548867.1 BtaA family protein [Hymenobacter translucens]
MQSEFYNVELDRLRYSLVWEGSATLYQALQLQPTDHALIICGAGCNVLNTLLQAPASVTAIDLNPAQSRLLQLKQHVIQHHAHPVFRGLIGFDGPDAARQAWAEVRATLGAEEQPYWESFFASHPGGILTAGRLESFITNFFATLDAAAQARLRHLLSFDNEEAQHRYFVSEVEPTDFRRQFIDYFDEANLSKGRDPKLFKYAEESGGEAFFARLRRHLGTQLARDNFFLRFFFFGPELPDHVLPPCYQAAHYETLRRQLPTLRIETGEAIDFLLSEEGRIITKASLSNIFEYVSPAEFERVCQALGQRGVPLRVVFWNLLLSQAEARTATIPLLAAESAKLSAHEACFYFRNVRVLSWEPSGD